MTTNKMTVMGSVIIILLIISIPTIYKLVENHNNDLYKVVEEKIIGAAKKCYYEDKCTNNTITLKELYDLEYLENISNPITKEYYNEESYVEVESFKFIVKE